MQCIKFPTASRQLATMLIMTLLAACSTTSQSIQQPDIDPSIISPEFPYTKQFVEVHGQELAYVDEGSGPVVLFLHGNPTSSYLWRNIIPYVADNHRAIAVDLIGMGDSAKPDIDYTFFEHAEFVDGFIEVLGLSDITLVIHDWGSVLGMRYARLNEDNVRALAFMEALMPPFLPLPSYEAMGDGGETFRDLRTDGIGEQMVLNDNYFIEEILPQMVVRQLSEQEMAEYRRPFATAESRLPTLMWPRQLPIAGEPASMEAEILTNGQWLAESPMPKLHLYARPGAGNPQSVVEYVADNVPNVKLVDVGEGLHFIQEDRPHEIGRALSDWLDSLAQ